MDKIVPAFETTLFDPTLSDACSELAEMGIDSLLDEGICKSIPVVSLLNILRWRSHPISWNRAMESVIESQSSDGGSHDPCRGSQ